MTTNKVIIINSKQGNFAFTKDDSNNLLCQSSLDYELYLSNNPNEQDNLSDQWDMVDMLGLDKEYIEIVEQAIKQLN
jgi:hypothetical protein|tara:strand:+ start:1619 stop:1849 length:231 start_codon:yes stop_codon:yes gene_type:complete